LARAKRTDRTEARRRHRVEQTAVAGDGAAVATAGELPRQEQARNAASGQAGQAERPSVTAALRGAFRPVNVRGDLRALPRLFIHWSFWGPALATIATTIVYIAVARTQSASTAAQDQSWVLVNLAFQMFVFPLPAPAGTAFIAGFGAPRASWLIGLILGVLAATCFAIVLYSVPSSLTSPTAPIDPRSLALQGFLVGPVGSALFAAAAAWYRRFLNLANPNRQQRRSQPAKAQQGRGDIKRDRLSH
jgi:hypothetical protein